MNIRNISVHSAFSTALALLFWIPTACHHAPKEPAKSTMLVTEVQAPHKKFASQPAEDPTEKRLQDHINVMQEQLSALSARTETLARFHGNQMKPEWIDKVRAARAEASRPAERIRYLEATEALLRRRLQALRAELKVYEEFEASDPSIPRP